MICAIECIIETLDDALPRGNLVQAFRGLSIKPSLIIVGGVCIPYTHVQRSVAIVNSLLHGIALSLSHPRILSLVFPFGGSIVS